MSKFAGNNPFAKDDTEAVDTSWMEAANNVFGAPPEKPKRREVVPEGAIVPSGDGFEIAGSGVRLSATSADFSAIQTVDQWEAVGSTLSRLQGAIQWWVGTWIIHARERGFDVQLLYIAQTFGIEVSTLKNWVLVCETFDPPCRHGELTFTHHQLVYSMSEKDREKWLSYAGHGTGDGDEWRVLTVSELRKAIAESRKQPKKETARGERQRKSEINFVKMTKPGDVAALKPKKRGELRKAIETTRKHVRELEIALDGGDNDH